MQINFNSWFAIQDNTYLSCPLEVPKSEINKHELLSKQVAFPISGCCRSKGAIDQIGSNIGDSAI